MDNHSIEDALMRQALGIKDESKSSLKTKMFASMQASKPVSETAKNELISHYDQCKKCTNDTPCRAARLLEKRYSTLIMD